MSVDRSNSGDRDVLHIEIGTHGGAVVLSVRGEVDALTAPQLQTQVEKLRTVIERAEQDMTVVIDLSRVGFLGSAGLSVLQFAAQVAAPRPLRVTVSPAARRVIEVTGLDRMFGLYDDLPSALADTAQDPTRN
ncbi:STAS domain-containing protein [Nocardia vaccinii]|uniref:STAS domain-containing protein n=1 Tax=Nocardia vaccinii TaxID=1822 RepID=UPI00083392FE|nr:STAS domain-containing protein [Nocardia vaccinii]